VASNVTPDWHTWLHVIQNSTNANQPLLTTNFFDMQNLTNLTMLNNGVLAIGMLANCQYCSGAGNQRGEITIAYANPADGTIYTTETFNGGEGNAYDLRVGIANNIFSNDGGYSLVSSKSVSHGIGLSPIGDWPEFQCTRDGVAANINISQYYGADTYVASFDANRLAIWQQTYADEDNYTLPALPPGNYKKQECMYAIVQTPDKGYLAAGNQSNNFDDNYLLKLYPENCAYAITNYDFIGYVHTATNGGIIQSSNILDPYGKEYWIDGGGTTTWNSSQKIKGSVIIKYGNTLHITGSSTTITFDDAKQVGYPSKLIVMPGAKLIVDNGATLTSVGNCVPGMWQGIEVWGDITQTQNITNGYATKQGYAIFNNATISNAILGVAAYDSREFETDNFASGINKTGGIVQANITHFLNNAVDADLRFYPTPLTTGVTTNISYFSNCDFKNNQMLADLALDESMICDMRPYIKYNKTHLGLWNVKGIKINGCNFETDLPAIGGKKPNYSTGISAFDASFTCTKAGIAGISYAGSTFSNLEFGIKNGSYNGSCSPNSPAFSISSPAVATINRCKFTNCFRGIQLDGTLMSQINRCTFDIDDAFGNNLQDAYYLNPETFIGNPIKIPVGIYTNAALNYTVFDNIFTSTLANNGVFNYGMVNSNASAFNFSNTKNNKYTNHYVNQQFEYNNNKLQSNCNEYNNTTFTNHYAWSVFDQLANQGVCNGTATNAATNIFSSVSVENPYMDIHLDAEAFNFEYRSLNASPIYEPQFHSAGVITAPCTDNDSVTLEQACPVTEYVDKVIVFNNHHEKYNQLLASYNSLKSMIDNGNTEALLQYAENNQLNPLANIVGDKKKLISDDVLLTTLENMPPTNWTEFYDIFMNNSPLSARVLSTFNSNSAIIPNPILLAVQNAQNGFSLMQQVQKQLNDIELEKGLALNQMLYYYLDTNRVDLALAHLAADPAIGSATLGLAIDPYNKYGYQFSNKLHGELTLLQRTSLDANLIAQLSNYINYYNNVLPNAQNLQHISGAQTEALKAIANVHSVDGTMATVALAAAGKATYGYNPKPINIVNGYRTIKPNEEVQEQNAIVIDDNNFVFNLVPNPTNGNVELQINSKQIKELSITDLAGKVLLQQANIQQSKITLNLEHLSNGIYFVKLSTYGGEIKAKKLIVTH